MRQVLCSSDLQFYRNSTACCPSHTAILKYATPTPSTCYSFDAWKLLLTSSLELVVDMWCTVRSSGNSMLHQQCCHCCGDRCAPWLTTTENSVRTPLFRTSGRPSVLRCCRTAHAEVLESGDNAGSTGPTFV